MKKLFTCILFCTLTFFATAQDTWEHSYEQGISWLSFPIEANNNFEDYIGPLDQGNIITLMDDEGSAYIPSWDFNGIGNIIPGDWYSLNLQYDVSTYIEGSFLDPSTINYSLDSGWNNIGNPRIEDADIEDVLSEITGFFICQDYLGNIYSPDYGTNNIGNYKTGQAYKIYVDQAQTITLPANSPTLAISSTVGCTNPTASNYNTNAQTDDHSCNSYAVPNSYTNSPYGGSAAQVVFIDMNLSQLNSAGINFGDAIMVSASVNGENTVLGWSIISDNSIAISLWYNANMPTNTTLNFYHWDIDNQIQTQLTPSFSIGSANFDINTNYAVISDFTSSDISSCNDPDACNYDANGTDNSSCIYADLYYNCAGDCLTDDNLDGICDELQTGCTDSLACNYDNNAISENGSCIYPETYYDCNGNCNNDANSNNICDELEGGVCNGAIITLTITPGLWLNEISYEITDTAGVIVYAGNDQSPLISDICLNDGEEYNFIAYDSYGDGWNGTLYNLTNNYCNPPLLLANNNGLTPDNLGFTPGADTESIESFTVYSCNDTILGCNDLNACNYNPYSNTNDGSCIYAQPFYDCDNNCINDIDQDGICDELDTNACTDAAACNYNAFATLDDGSCEYAQAYMDCDGLCINDADEDGLCDEYEVFGCTDLNAINYNAQATNNDGSCEYDSYCTYPELDDINTGTNMTVWFTYPAMNSLMELGNSITIIAFGAQSGTVVGYENMDGSQTSMVMTIWGDDYQTPEIDGALNSENIVFQALVDGVIYDLIPNTIVNYLNNDIVIIDDFDYSFLCGISSTGCTDEQACNYSSFVSEDDGSCVYAEDYYDCDNNCLIDSDGDGVCDENEVPGCGDPYATNYDSNATELDNCIYTTCDENIAFSASNFNNYTASISINPTTIPDFILNGGGYIGAFTQDNQNNYACIGMTSLPVTAFLISGDNPNTAMIEGAVENEQILFFALSYTGHLFELESNESFYYANASASEISQGAFNFACLQQQPMAGCTDANACNYTPAATIDNGSCTYVDFNLTYDNVNNTITSDIDETIESIYFYNWYLDGVPVLSDGDNTYTPNQNGIYSLEIGIDVVNPNINDLCVGTQSIEITGLSIKELNKIISIYPNPSNNLLTITNTSGEILHLSIYSVIGNLMREESLNNIENIISVKEFAEGMYFFHLTDGERQSIHKIKIQR